MGVHGLWSLLRVSARRVSLETLEGRTLAIDASIWIIQLVKAMRHSDGSPMANAHLIGTFTRLCKLLYYGVHAVFVFDGPEIPPLKERTLRRRRTRRAQTEANHKRAAQKLLALKLREKKLKNAITNRNQTEQHTFNLSEKEKVKVKVKEKDEGKGKGKEKEKVHRLSEIMVISSDEEEEEEEEEDVSMSHYTNSVNVDSIMRMPVAQQLRAFENLVPLYSFLLYFTFFFTYLS